MHDPRFAGKLLFIEDYDINVARHLVQGVDVWLNNPRRPLEASGTSGEKVILNGGLNLSVLDGWWAEAYDGLNGFAIGMGETHSSTDVHDARDAESLGNVLRNEVIPLYYNRDRDGLPRAWITRMKRAIRTLGYRFSADANGEGLRAEVVHSSRRRHQQRHGPLKTRTTRPSDFASWETQAQCASEGVQSATLAESLACTSGLCA